MPDVRARRFSGPLHRAAILLALAATAAASLGSSGASEDVASGQNAEPVGHPPGNLRFETIDLLAAANHHIAASSWTIGQVIWFDQEGLDLGRLPVGQRRRGGIPYYVVDFHTAPANEALVLGEGVPGLPPSLAHLPDRISVAIGANADMLYFMHAAHVPGWKPASSSGEEALAHAEFPILALVRLHYDDGTHHDHPLHLGRDVGHWLQPEPPAPLPNAALAWAHRFREQESAFAVLHSHALRNPRPDREIHSLEFRLPPEIRPGAYALLALTIARSP
ncbi:MAG: hypothetical protein EA425_11275 [Puniceicoccaceae bacterium]|nr:MAG: hypothetical protein EA425_11275 [Puniceicoccaceae bacterium]